MPTPSVIDTVSKVLGESENLVVQYDPPADGPRQGCFVPLAESSLHCSLHEVAKRVAPLGLYTHQQAAVESVLAGRNTIAATRTSSGKSLVFSLPALDAMCRDEQATSLFLYPQKALANDQLSKLREQISMVPQFEKLLADKPFLVSRYDGGVPSETRKSIRGQVQLLLTNPDMLHLGILQHHQTGWARFFGNLKTVAIDECHEYRGIFGTNVAYVLRRLRQVCKMHGTDPTFVATSATIAAPQQHLRNLVGADFQLVGPEQDGSLQGRRKFWMVGGSEHHYDAGRKLATSLADAGLNVLTFCPSRIAAERMLGKMRDTNGELPEHVAVYRSGLTAEEREDIECKLRAGTKRLVFTTSALELGIDIGGLDVVVCIGLAIMAELQNAIEVKLDVAIASLERLMANLFPTISGPCDSQDYSSGIDRTKSGELAIFLYDNVYDGVNLTELAFERMSELLLKVRERIETCNCQGDGGCVRCAADPMRENLSSKRATLHAAQALLSILQNESPKTIDFASMENNGDSEPTAMECPECGESVKVNAKFCSNCGHSMKELANATT